MRIGAHALQRTSGWSAVRRRFRVAAVSLAAFLSGGCAWIGSTVKGTKPQSDKPDSVARSSTTLVATFATARGDIEVKLLADEAPRTVENFVGLATGKKAWTHPKTGRETSSPLYGGTAFFRVIPGFIIQGGDPTDTGYGGPGYDFADEFYPGRGFDRPGLLAMANSGPNSNGSQFFLTVTAAPWLNEKHTIFGEVVKGLEIAQAMALAPRMESDSRTGTLIDRPLAPEILKEVRVEER